MIANSAFLAAIVVMLTAFVAGELSFLSRYKALILHHYLSVILGTLAVVFLNLFALCDLTARGLFLFAPFSSILTYEFAKALTHHPRPIKVALFGPVRMPVHHPPGL